MFVPDVTLREEKPCARPYSLLILHIGKMGMWPGEGCEAGRQFPDVTHKDLKVSGRVFSSRCIRCGTKCAWKCDLVPDVRDEEFRKVADKNHLPRLEAAEGGVMGCSVDGAGKSLHLPL